MNLINETAVALNASGVAIQGQLDDIDELNVSRALIN
jgi:hypothetical protein